MTTKIKNFIAQIKQSFALKIEYFHVSVKYVSGVFMLSVSVLGAVFLLDPSMFSASLITEKVFSEDSNFSEDSEKLGGVLVNSPLYELLAKTQKELTVNNVLISFVKTVKASKKSESLAEDSFATFTEQLESLEFRDQLEVLDTIIHRTETLSIAENVFPYVFKVHAMVEQENNLVFAFASELNQLDKKIVKDRGAFVFEAFNNYGVESLLANAELKTALSNIKTAMIAPVEKDGEVFYAASEDWMEGNELWKSL